MPTEPHIYLFDNLDSLEDDFVTKNLPRLPTFRQEQCAKYKRVSDKQNCIIAYLLLEQGLRAQYGITTPVSFIYNKHGKPYLREHPNIFFNVSHCKHGVICGLGDVEIGVDIQDIRPFKWNVARRVCSKSELLELEEAEDPSRLFCMMWAKREAYAKARGVSVASVLQLELEDATISTWEYENYCIAWYSLY